MHANNHATNIMCIVMFIGHLVLTVPLNINQVEHAFHPILYGIQAKVIDIVLGLQYFTYASSLLLTSNNLPASPLDSSVSSLLMYCQTYINKEHVNHKLRPARSKFTYINKWTSHDQIYHKRANQLWKNHGIIDAQII